MSAQDNFNDEDYKIEILPEDYPQYDLSFKLIFIGDSSVGKSCLTTKAVKNEFEDYYQATVGFEFMTFNLKINDKIIKLQIWDTCGQEIYKSLISNFYRNSSLAVLVYSIDSKESFIHVENWLNDLKSQANEDVRIILVGNKADLENEREISKEEGMLLAKQEDYEFDECSCLKNINVASAFETLLERWNFERHKEKEKETDLTFRKSAKIKKKKFQRNMTEYNLEIEDDIENNKERSRYNSMVFNLEKSGNIKLKNNGQRKKKKICCKQ